MDSEDPRKWPRYSRQPFPPYRHRPGQTPHPLRHPEGHSFGKPESPGAKFVPERWQVSEGFLEGVDLFNSGYYWEAHEAWEGIWRTTGRKDIPGLFLQGLIQVSAALLKREMGMTRGMTRLSMAGLQKLRHVRNLHVVYCGLNLDEFVSRLDRFFRALEAGNPGVDPGIRLQPGAQDPGPASEA